MCYQQQHKPSNYSQRLPSQLTILNAVLLQHSKPIVEDTNGSLKIDAVFPDIASGLPGIPFEFCCYRRALYHFCSNIESRPEAPFCDFGPGHSSNPWAFGP